MDAKTAENLLGQIPESDLLKKENRYDNALTKFLRPCCIIPQRYILGVMGLLGVCNAYTMRVCLNLAITQMVNNTHRQEAHFDPDACPSDDIDFTNGTTIMRPVRTFSTPFSIGMKRRKV